MRRPSVDGWTSRTTISPKNLLQLKFVSYNQWFRINMRADILHVVKIEINKCVDFYFEYVSFPPKFFIQYCQLIHTLLCLFASKFGCCIMMQGPNTLHRYVWDAPEYGAACGVWQEVPVPVGVPGKHLSTCWRTRYESV